MSVATRSSMRIVSHSFCCGTDWLSRHSAQVIGSALLAASPVVGGLTMLLYLSLLSFSELLVLGYGVVVQLVTLLVELDASFKKALPLLSVGYISDAQLGPSKSFYELLL